MNGLDARAFALVEIRRHLGRVYVWGLADCSQLISEVLTATAKVGWASLFDGTRRTAQGLYEHFTHRGCPTVRDKGDLRPGMLVFYRNPGARIHHVSMHVCMLPSGTPMCIEAGGAGSQATSFEKALHASGSVRFSDSDYHGQGVEWLALDPFSVLS